LDDADTFELTVPPESAGERLDRWLAAQNLDLSRSRIQGLIVSGCLLDGAGEEVSDASRKVRAGDDFVLHVPPPEPAVPEPENIPLDVIYEDDDLIVINKPVGLVVHPAPGHSHGTLVNALLHHCRGSLSGIGGVTRPGIVHRLDKDTSGIMVCAKSDIAHRGLVEQFQVHSIERAYFALVWGVPNPAKGRLETQIGRDPRDRKRMAVLSTGGKTAITEYARLRTIRDVVSLMDCRLFTGRTHQIRVHMLSIGHPLVGDPVYKGRSTSKFTKNSVIRQALAAYKYQALQAHTLGFVHPRTGEEKRFDTGLSKDLTTLIDTIEVL
jgi:23S rRNA pseudouridine1911/1915/1917 synthase